MVVTSRTEGKLFTSFYKIKFLLKIKSLKKKKKKKNYLVIPPLFGDVPLLNKFRLGHSIICGAPLEPLLLVNNLKIITKNNN